jgi:hypothetical protein
MPACGFVRLRFPNWYRERQALTAMRPDDLCCWVVCVFRPIYMLQMQFISEAQYSATAFTFIAFLPIAVKVYWPCDAEDCVRPPTEASSMSRLPFRNSARYLTTCSSGVTSAVSLNLPIVLLILWFNNGPFLASFLWIMKTRQILVRLIIIFTLNGAVTCFFLSSTRVNFSFSC